MKKFNIIGVFNSTSDKILMCKRNKEPYKGLYNFVGGKIEENESSLDAAYRELSEETSISPDSLTLHHLIDFNYYTQNISLEVFVGKLNTDISVYGEENDLFWIDLTNNFFDITKYAGEGNIGHILEHLYKYKNDLLK